MQQMRRFESDEFDPVQSGAKSPQSGPEALGLDADIGEVADFFTDLRVIAEIGDEVKIALSNEDERAGTGESGEVAHVRETREHECVDVRRGERVTKRGDARRAAISHWPPPEVSLPARAAPARIHTSRIHRQPPARHQPAQIFCAPAHEHKYSSGALRRMGF